MSDQAYATLESVSTTLATADGYFATFKWENAVQTYQVAGTQGQALRTLLRPQPALDQADALDQQLQALQWRLASQQAATTAQGLARHIFALYRTAYANSPAAQATPAAPGPPAAQRATSTLLWLGITLGVGALVYLLIKGPAVGSPLENPTGLFGGAKPRRKKRLIDKGGSVALDLKDGRTIRPPGEMLHDPSGKAWPRSSVLIGPSRGQLRAATRDEFDDDAQSYLGRDHLARASTLETPPKPLGAGWTYVGDVEEIRYTRRGRKQPGAYYHPFNKMGLTRLIHGKGRVRLYRRGRYHRLELPRNATLDARGFVHP